MIYEVRKDGRTLAGTDTEACRYSPEVEADMQAAGYAIYVNGKRQPRRKQAAAQDRKK